MNMHNPYKCTLEVSVTEDGMLEVNGITPEGCSELERLPVSLIFTGFIGSNLAELAAAANIWFHGVLEKKAQGKSDTIAETAPKIVDAGGAPIQILPAVMPAKDQFAAAEGNVTNLADYRKVKGYEPVTLNDQPKPDFSGGPNAPGDGL